MRYFFTALIVMFSFRASAQDSLGTKNVYEEFSFRVDVGRSFIQVYSESDLYTENGNSGNVGLVWIHHYKDNAFLRIEFAVSIHHTSHDQNVAFHGYRDRFEYYDMVTVKKRVDYFVFPVLYGIEGEKFSFAGGIQFGIISGGQLVVKKNRTVAENPEYPGCFHVRGTPDLGPRFTASWKLGRKLNLEGSYYHGLNNIAGDCSDDSEEWNLTQLSLGLRWSFHFYTPDPLDRQIRKELRKNR